MQDDWQVVLPRKDVAAARVNPKLGPFFAVSRAANAITIARGPLVHDTADDSAQASRERFSALFYVAAVLVEALTAAEGLTKHFSGVPQFDEGFGQLLTDPQVTEYRMKTLTRFRHKGTFHFDGGFFRAAVSQLPDDEIVLATVSSTRIEDIYLNVADDLLFRHILGPFADDDAMVTAFVKFSDNTTGIMNRFLVAAHQLVPVVLKELGAFKRRAV